MYDPQTEELIRNAPALEGLNVDELPRLLTEHFSEISASRLALSAATPADSERLALIDERLRRLAHTYEVMVCVLPTHHPQRASAAFVSATAHTLLGRLAQVTGAPSSQDVLLGTDQIAREVAALILFCIAGAFPDAMQVAESLRHDREQSATRQRLIITLGRLARGQLHGLGEGFAGSAGGGGSPVEDATDALYEAILAAVIRMGQEILGMQSSDEGSVPQLERVRQLAGAKWVENGPLSLEEDLHGSVYFVLGGPHHLATLLKTSYETFFGRSLTRIAPPSGPDGDKWARFLYSLARNRPLLWPNHLDALSKGFLEPGTSSVVTFPTGAGKTTLVELKIACALFSGKSAVFLVPTHALEDQVRGDLRRTFPGYSIGRLLSEDELLEAEAEDAQVFVTTPERCLSVLGYAPERLGNVGVIVFDECHLLHPDEGVADRRSLEAMFCTLGLIGAAQEADLVLLSAMVANGPKLAAWIAEQSKRRCLALDLAWKPTRQARGCVVYQSEEVAKLKKIVKKARAAATTKGPPAVLQRQLRAKAYGFMCLRKQWTPSPSDYLLRPLLPGDGLVPLTASRFDDDDGDIHWNLSANRYGVSAAISANLARRGLRTLALSQSARNVPGFAKQVADALSGVTPTILTTPERELLGIAESEMGGRKHVLAIEAGLVCMHYGDMLPVERRLSEVVFKRKDGCQVLVASPTMSMGVNLPAEAVVIAGDDRWDPEKEEPQPLPAPELLNAAGRAGRAGTCPQGLVLVVPGRVVGTDIEASKIHQRWLELQQNVFSKADQCLEVADPIDLWLDELVVKGMVVLSDEARYFLTRLPVGPGERDEAAQRLLSRTFAAFLARERGGWEGYAAKIQQVLDLRRKHVPAAPLDWHDEMSCTTGVPSTAIADLDAFVSSAGDISAVGTLELVDWFVGWLSRKPDFARTIIRPKELLGTFYRPKGGQRPSWGAQTILRVATLSRLWMTGASLREVELALGTPAGKVKECSLARGFVADVIPDLSFGAGLLARVYREGRGRSDPGASVPLALQLLSSCIREGLSSPEHLAVAGLLGEGAWRTVVHRTHAGLSIEPGNRNESFGSTRQRVRRAMGAE